MANKYVSWKVYFIHCVGVLIVAGAIEYIDDYLPFIGDTIPFLGIAVLSCFLSMLWLIVYDTKYKVDD